MENLVYTCPVCSGDIDEISDFDYFGEYECPYCGNILYIGINTETNQIYIIKED